MTLPPSASPADRLDGTWTTRKTTCPEQNAALDQAGFTEDQLLIGGWDVATCGGMMHGRTFMIRFAGDRLRIFQDGVAGWDGLAQVTDQRTFMAGNATNLYLTYHYVIDGDQLTVDMTQDDYPTTSTADLMGDRIAQTVIYETAPFQQASVADESPAASGDVFTSAIYPYALTLPTGWSATPSGVDEDFFDNPDNELTLSLGSGQPEPGQTVTDRVAVNRAAEFADCETDPSQDRPVSVDGEPGILWSARCGTLIALAANTIHRGRGYRLTMKGPAEAEADMRTAMDQVLQGFVFED